MLSLKSSNIGSKFPSFLLGLLFTNGLRDIFLFGIHDSF